MLIETIGLENRGTHRAHTPNLSTAETRRHVPELDILRADLRDTFPGAVVGQVVGSGSSAHIIAVDRQIRSDC